MIQSMQNSKIYTTSVNINRDGDRELVYHPTPNAQKVIGQIINNFKVGLRAFNIIGSYGTGKSSLLWAFEQSLLNRKEYFDISLVKNPNLKIIKLVGEYRSIIEAFTDEFKITATKDISKQIFSEIYNQYHDLGKDDPLLIIIIDEFGKFLEYAAKYEPERELYFIQELAEFVNNSDRNICLISTVHQNFDAYSNNLSKEQKYEWSKVKGRFREITFNEPVEQLLFLAAEHLNSTIDTEKEDSFLDIQNAIEQTKTFKFSEELIKQIAPKLFPLDLMAANALTVSLQKYGQNERSLFSFLESTDYWGIKLFKASKEHPFYSIADVYDYLINNYYSFLNSKDNPDFTAWASIRASIEKIERFFDDIETIEVYNKLIKTIGLLEITAPKGSIIIDTFLIAYSKNCLGIENPTAIINDLINRKIIIKRAYSKRYVLLDGTDLDIHTAINEAGNKISEITDIVSQLEKYYSLSPVIAKMESYQSGTPRLFEFLISESPKSQEPIDEIDGFINLIFNEDISLNELISISKKEKNAIIYGFYKNTKRVRNQLFEIEKTQRVILENSEDKVAIRELGNILKNHQSLLNHYILDGFYSGEVAWIFNGQEQPISNKRDFNKLLSIVCKTKYPYCPVFRNELINKHKVPGQIHTARKEFFKQLVSHWNDFDLGYEKDKFPPQKTIFLSLIKENGIKIYDTDFDFEPSIAENSNFKPLWDYCVSFLNKSKYSKLPVSELFKELSRQPFKLKKGLIELWIPTFLFIKRFDIALFGDSVYLADLTGDILELIARSPEKYEVKAFNLDGVRLDLFNSYRTFLQQSTQSSIGNKTFIETIKPFLDFYGRLPEYAKNTKRVSQNAQLIREAIVKAKDPEKTFFEDFPTALGYSFASIQQSKFSLEEFISSLEKSIRELRLSYEDLIKRYEDFILNEFIGESLSFEEYKSILQKRYSNLQKPLLMTHQKAFIQRLDSPLDDKIGWLSSIAQLLVGRSLNTFKDEDEGILYNKFKQMILDLDNLNTISNIDIDETKEDAVGIEISSFSDGINKTLLRIPKSKKPAISKIESDIRMQMSEDDSLNIIALTNLLKELLHK